MHFRNVLLVVLLIAAAACKRETFEPATHPMTLRVINPGKPIDLLAEPLKEQMISWDARQVPELEIEGVLNIEYRDEYYQYLQLKCAAGLKCNGSNAYAPVSLAMQLHPDGKIAKVYSRDERKKRPFLIIPSEQSQNIDALLAWMKNPSADIPEMFDRALLVSTADYFIDSLPAPEQESRIAGWYYLGLAMKDEEHDSNFDPFLKRFKDIDKIINVDAREKDIADAEKKGQDLPGELASNQIEFLQTFREFVDERFMESLDSYYYDFPFLAKDNAGLATAMNSQKLPIYNERVLKDLLAESDYAGTRRVVLNDPRGTLENSISSEEQSQDADEENRESEEDNTERSDTSDLPGETRSPTVMPVASRGFSNTSGLSIQVGSDPSVHITSVQAKPHKLGLALKVQGVHRETKSKLEYELEPQKESTYLIAARKSTLERFRSLKDDEIMGAADFRTRLLLATLKYGQGSYDRKERKFQYVVYMDSPSYWRFLTIIKSNEMIDVRDENTYSGALDLPNSESELRWAQHYDRESELSQLKLHGQFHICERGCWDEKIEVSCFDNTRQSYLVAEFPARVLMNSENENPPVEFILVHERLQAGYYHLQQACSEAMGVPVQNEFNDWIVAFSESRNSMALR